MVVKKNELENKVVKPEKKGARHYVCLTTFITLQGRFNKDYVYKSSQVEKLPAQLQAHFKEVKNG